MLFHFYCRNFGYKALEDISECPHQKFIIFIDSLIALKSLQYPKHSSHLLILKALDFIYCVQSQNVHLLFSWIPSYVRIMWNDLIDRASKSAASCADHDSLYCDITKLIIIIQQQWQMHWDVSINSSSSHLDQYFCLVISDFMAPRFCFNVFAASWYIHRHLFGKHPPMCINCDSLITVSIF